MGYALTQAALDMGHQVTLITAPTALQPPQGAKTIEVISAEDMFEAVQAHFALCQALIMAAAVSDYTLANPSETKLKKSDQNLTLELVPTQDILLWAGRHKQTYDPARIVIGFALEDQAIHARAEDKLIRKHLDMIIANTPDAIGVSASTLSLKTPDTDWFDLPQADKQENARLILQQVCDLLDC